MHSDPHTLPWSLAFVIRRLLNLNARMLIAPMVLILGLGQQSLAARVVVVLSIEAAPYREAEKAINTQLVQSGHSVKTVLLASINTKSAEQLAAIGDGVIAVGTDASVWLHAHLPEKVPLVYCMVADPAAAGLTTGRPISGVRVDVPIKDQIQVISEALPAARTIGLLYRSDNEKSVRGMEAVKAQLLAGWKLEAVAIDQRDSVAAAIEVLMGRGTDVVLTGADPSVYDQPTLRTLLLAALRKKLPVFGFSGAVVRAGAMIGTGVEPRSQGADAGDLMESALRTPSPSPAGTPRSARVQVLVNTAVAEQLGVKLPSEFMQRAIAVAKTN